MGAIHAVTRTSVAGTVASTGHSGMLTRSGKPGELSQLCTASS